MQYLARKLTIINICLYFIAVSVHIGFLLSQFRYMGYTNGRVDIFWFLLGLTVLGQRNELTAYNLYHAVFLWFIYIPTYVGSFFFDGQDLWVIRLLLISSVILIRRVSRLKVKKIVMPKVDGFHRYLMAFAIMSGIYLLFSYKSIMSLHTLSDIYSYRATFTWNRAIDGYLVMWMYIVISPYFVIIGIRRNKLQYLLMGILVALLAYSINAQKLVLGILVLSFLLLKTSNLSLTTIGQVILAVVIVFMVIPIPLIFKAIFLQRTVYNSGLLNLQYFQFFSEHELLFWSRSFPFSLFLDYPYSSSIGQEVYSAFYQTGEVSNSNANFWITDGYASFGCLGAFLITFICSLCIKLLEHLFIGDKLILFFFFLSVLLNTGFFTSVFSGGLWLLVLISLYDDSSFKYSTSL